MSFGQFFSQNLFLFLLLGVVLVLLARLEWRNYQNRIPRLSPLALGPFVNSGGVLIDLRSQEDFRRGHINGASNHPAEHFQLGTFHVAKDKSLLLYNGDGYGLETIVAQLLGAGYRVSLLDGGLNSWTAENLPLQRHK